MTIVYKILLIMFILLFIILFMPIKIQLIRNVEDKNKKRKNEMNMYLVKLFKLKIDFDGLINKNNKGKNIIDNIKNIKQNKEYLKNVLGFMLLTKSTIIVETSSIYVGFGGWNGIYMIRNLLYEYFLDVDNEYYNVILKENTKTNYKYEFVFYCRLIFIIYGFIMKYATNAIKLIQKKKGGEEYGRASNKRFVPNIDG